MSGSSSSGTDFKSAKDIAEKEPEPVDHDDDDVFETSDCFNNPTEGSSSVRQGERSVSTVVSSSLSSSVSSYREDEEALWAKLSTGAKSLCESASGIVYIERYQSFVYNNWPYDVKKGNLCHPRALALAGLGFHSLNPSPTAQCQVCLTVISDLESNSNAWVLHAEANPECYLVKLGQRDDVDDYTMVEFMEMAYMKLINIAERKVREKENDVKQKLFALQQKELKLEKLQSN